MAAKPSPSSSESAMLSNLWQNLTDLSVNDPDAYNKIAVESAKQGPDSIGKKIVMKIRMKSNLKRECCV